MMVLALGVFSFILVLFTLFSSTYCEVWWVRGTDFPRLQFVILGIGLIGLELSLLDFSAYYYWPMVLATFACILYHSCWILPYTRLYSHQVLSSQEKDPPNTLSVLMANVLQTNDRYEELLSIVRENDPDILVALETDKKWEKVLDTLGGSLPYSVKCPLDNLYGMHVYSKFELKDSKIQFLKEKDIPSIHTAITLPSGKNIIMHFMHPIPPRPARTGESSQRDAELIMVGKAIAKHKSAVIVSGDLNDVAWSKTTRLFLKTSHLLDPRVGRGMFNTFNAKYFFIRWPLDHLFHSDHFTLSRIKRLPKFGSDHFPVLIELVYDESKRKLQNIPHPNKKERRLAREKMQSENVNSSEVHIPQP